jgi:hypothetical protein
MKKLTNPPVQGLLMLAGAALLGVAGWSLATLKLQDASQNDSASEVSVHIPDSRVLDIPEMDAYPKMVDTPLFWASRKRLEAPAQVAEEKPVTPTDTTLPEGRLIGIIDMGDHLFGIMAKEDGSSIHLKTGDRWGAWKVSGIDPDKVILALGDQKQDIALVGDFAAPKENPQVAQARVDRQKVAAKQQIQNQLPAATQAQLAQVAQMAQAKAGAVLPADDPVAQPNAAGQPQTAGLPFPADTDKQPPALSVTEALEARQRLMASRWGKLAGDTEGNAPPIAAQ